MNQYYMGCGNKLLGTPDQLAHPLLDLERHGHFIAEPKLDGQWVCVESRGKVFDRKPPRVTSRSGRRLKIELHHIPENIRMVGELIDGAVHVFDLLHGCKEECADKSWFQRRLWLEQLFECGLLQPSEGYELVPQFSNNFAGRFDTEAEGLVLKDVRGGAYRLGKTDEWMKVKRIDRHDVEVVGLDTGKESARIIHANGPLRGHAAGKVPLCGWPVAVGDVLEIEAFKLYPSGRFRSPVIKRIRKD